MKQTKVTYRGNADTSGSFIRLTYGPSRPVASVFSQTDCIDFSKRSDAEDFVSVEPRASLFSFNQEKSASGGFTG